VDGFYDPLLSFIDMAVNEGFIKEDARRIIISAPTAKELVLKLEVKFQFRSIAREAADAIFDRLLLTPSRTCDSQEYVPEYEVGLVWEDQMPAVAAAAAAHGFVPELEPGIASS